ncbi:MAG TPA: ABC transporter permease subunit [Nakamurella sp.]|nr:ABC transporter permease subunit [Nakamurella sp.]
MTGTLPIEPAALETAPEPADTPPRPRRTLGSIITRAVAGFFAILLLVFILGPLLWMAIAAFAKRWKYPNMLPQAWTLDWWGRVLGGADLLPALWLSVKFAVLATLLACVICLPAAYALGRANFPGRRVILLGLFATNAFPKMGLFTSIATLFYAMQLMNTQLGVIIVQMLGTVVTMTWIPAAAFASVSPSLIEAARDAGAGKLRVFFQITMRLAAPGIAVAVILAFLACFDEAQGTYLIGAPTYLTMPTKMYQLVTNYPQQAAAVFALVLCVPSVLLLLLVRRHVMGGHLAEGFQLK